MPAKKLTKKAAAKKSVAKKSVKKTTAAKKAPAKKVVTKKVAKKAVVKKTTMGKTVAKKAAKKTSPKKLLTTVTVKYDVGMGNLVTIRGEGTGLSWDTGIVMDNIDSDTWVWSTSKAKSEIAIKILINDDTWSLGSNLVIPAGSSLDFTPAF